MSSIIVSSLEMFAREQGSPGCRRDVLNSKEDNSYRGYGPGASAEDHYPVDAPVQPDIPREYLEARPDELKARILAAKKVLDSRLLILGHFYQRDDVVCHADFVGDSFQLARVTLEHPEVDHIVFCGVHFMAETADILSADNQSVSLPNLGAGCSMADMADLPSVEACWQSLMSLYGEEPDGNGRRPIIPVTYMNSSAALKAFCGRHGGIVCTSSNAAKVLEWAYQQGQRVLFFPDQHLGRNTAHAMGMDLDTMPLWYPDQPWGGQLPEELKKAKVILWHGYCSVHKRFTPGQINAARRHFPNVRIVVHPECSLEVVQAADEAGSTDYIKKAIEAAPSGSIFGIGTEINLVRRLAKDHPQHTIFCLDPVVCPCSTMYRIHPAYLAWVLEGLIKGEIHNRIRVDDTTAANARIALERMLAAQP